MKKYYYVRDRRVDVDEIEGVVAVRIAVDAMGALRATASSYGTSAQAELEGSESEEVRESLGAFEKANWVFVKPSAEFSRTLSARDRRADTEESGKLVRRADQTVVIDSGLLNVQLDPSLTEGECEAILAREGLELLNKLRFAKNLYETRAVGHEDAMAASVALHGNDDIVFAEPAFVEHIPLRAAPTDPDYGDQWQWENDGSGGGTAGADVSAEATWDHTLGADVRVAVIDNGFDADHEDLDAGVGGQSGYFSAGAPAGFTQGTTGMPGSNHGTFCAGMVGARRNNGRGGVGAAPACEFTLVACLGDQVGTQTTLARAVAYAADPSTEVAGEDPANGADIIVSSLGPNGAVWNRNSSGPVECWH